MASVSFDGLKQPNIFESLSEVSSNDSSSLSFDFFFFLFYSSDSIFVDTSPSAIVELLLLNESFNR